MAAKQNITISLDKDLIKALRVLAANRESSISGLIGHELRRLVEQSRDFELAKRKALAALDTALHLGGSPAGRDELHER